MLHGLVLVAVVLLKDLNDLVEAHWLGELLVLEHVHGDLVELELIDGLNDFVLDVEGLTEGSSLQVDEVEAGSSLNAIWVGTALDLERDEHVEGLHLVDKEIDRKHELFKRIIWVSTAVDALKGESLLPWPVSVVLDDHLDHDGLSWAARMDHWWDSDSKSSVLLPLRVATSATSPASLTMLALGAHHVLDEGSGHLADIFKGLWSLSIVGLLLTTKMTPWAVMATSASPSTTSSAMTTSWTVMAMMVISEEGWILVDVLLNISLSIWHLLIDDAKNGLWSLLWLVDLQEWMVMLSSLLAVGAEVEVLADATLVSGTNDWGLAAAIALDSLVDSLRGGVDL